LKGRRKIFQNAPPVALVIGSASVALINDDEVKKIRWILAKAWRWVAFAVCAGHKGLKDGKEDTPVFGHTSFLADLIRRDTHKGVFGKGGKSVVGLVGKDITVR